MNAKDKLKEVMSHRNWHGGKFGCPRTAAVYKSLHLKGRLSYEKSCEMLTTLGYVKLQEEYWVEWIDCKQVSKELPIFAEWKTQEEVNELDRGNQKKSRPL
jgi:hypothetical protein